MHVTLQRTISIYHKTRLCFKAKVLIYDEVIVVLEHLVCFVFSEGLLATQINCCSSNYIHNLGRMTITLITTFLQHVINVAWLWATPSAWEFIIIISYLPKLCRTSEGCAQGKYIQF